MRFSTSIWRRRLRHLFVQGRAGNGDDFCRHGVNFVCKKYRCQTGIHGFNRLTNEFCMQKMADSRRSDRMLNLDFHPTGRHFLQIPGPSPVPDRILRAMSLPTIDHRGPEFGALGLQGAGGHPEDLPDPPSGDDLPGLRHRRLGGGAGQHPEPRRPRADVRDRPLRRRCGNKMAARLGLQTEFLALPAPSRCAERAGATACRPT